MRCTWFVAALAAAGCAGELEHPERFATCPPGYVEQLFATRCAGPCHEGAEAEAALDLVATGLEARLVGETSATPFCEGRLLIDPDGVEPADHLLLDKLQEQPSCGARMPFGGEALSASEIECVRRWVNETIGQEDTP
jgi:hypothetical protein